MWCRSPLPVVAVVLVFMAAAALGAGKTPAPAAPAAPATGSKPKTNPAKAPAKTAPKPGGLGVRQQDFANDQESFTGVPASQMDDGMAGGGSEGTGGPGGAGGPGDEKEPVSQEFICTVFGGPSCPDDQPIKVPCLCEGDEPCQCIPFYQCDKSTGSFNEFGVGVIDIRQGNTSCPHYLYKCCKTPASSAGTPGVPNPQPYPQNPQPDPEPYPTNTPYNPQPDPEPYPQNPSPPYNPQPDPEPYPQPSTESYPQNPPPYNPQPEPLSPSAPAPVPHLPTRCGQRNPEGIGVRITGDVDGEAQFGEFPWMVAILKVETSDDDRKRNLYQCGGALITPQIVLTAAHCVKNSQSTPRQLKIRAGEWDTQTAKELYHHQDVRVEDIVIHQDYYAGAVHNDVALLFLNDPVVIGFHIGTICMPEQDQNFDFQRCFVSGWGKDKFGQQGRYQVILKKLELPIVPHGECQEQLRKTRLGQFFKLHHSFMCAGGDEGKDTCKGDGGSPLVCPMPGDPTRYQLAGTVAWGIDCGLAGVPGVYGNIALFRNWVDEQLLSHNIDNAPYLP